MSSREGVAEREAKTPPPEPQQIAIVEMRWSDGVWGRRGGGRARRKDDGLPR